MYISLQTRARLYLTLSLSFLLTGGSLFAQPLGFDNNPRSNDENSPYSRYGIGNMSNPFNATSRGVAGSDAASGTPGLKINDFNPASYSFLNAATIDFGFEGRKRTVNMDDQRTSSGTGNFSYINLGMKIGNHLGLSFGFRPIAYMYYNANDTTNIQGMGKTINNYNGSGDLQYAYVGMAGQYKGLSVGASFGYAFGTYDYNTTLQPTGFLETDTTFPSQQARGAQKTIDQVMGGIYWRGGIIYQAKLPKKKYFNIGATATLSQKLNVTQKTLGIGYTTLFQDGYNEVVMDTVLNKEEKGKLTLPASYSFGASFGKENGWEASASFMYSDWEKYQKMEDRDGVGNNSWRGAIGMSVTPGSSSSGSHNYLSFMTYRIGGYYGKDYFQFANHDIHYFGGTFGITLPLQRNYNSMGTISMAIDVGQRNGSKSLNLPKETYINFTFGISFNDTYWLKRPAKYD